jgi:hypothetical protein
MTGIVKGNLQKPWSNCVKAYESINALLVACSTTPDHRRLPSSPKGGRGLGLGLQGQGQHIDWHIALHMRLGSRWRPLVVCVCVCVCVSVCQFVSV